MLCWTLLGLRLTLICFILVLLHYSGAQTGTCGRKDKVQMTVMSFKSKDAGSVFTQPLPHFECYLGAGDDDAAMTSIRAYNTRTNNDGKGHPVSTVSGTGIPDLPAGTAGYSVSITPANSNAFGAFTCTARKADREDTTIMIIFLHANAYVIPVNRQFTQTVNAGDNGVLIDMEWSRVGDNSWRINGSKILADRAGDKDFIINTDAATGDNGLYECHIDRQRDQALHGLNRLIVRACSSGRWGPPGCTGICDNCYNGGVCDDETGRCICAPGFMGQNCLTGCGPDKFGYSCEFECTVGNGATDDGCLGRLFCLIDPFGCRCNSGFKDLNCSVECEPGKYGAGCLQDCHCENQDSCNRFTGECDTEGCQATWSGNNCQIPDVCPEGYYGNQCTDKCLCLDGAVCDKLSGRCEGTSCVPGSMLVPNGQSCLECQAGFFGDNCTEECHCDSDACDRVTGECVGCCKNQWVDLPPSRCQEGIINVTGSKTNPGTQWSVTCWVEELQQNSPKYTVVLSQTMDLSSTPLQASSSLTAASNRAGFIQRGSIFTTTDAQAGTTYYCVISGFAWLNTTLSHYDLPIISESPEIVDMSQTSITIKWRAWDEGTDFGDPPVVGYIVYYRKDATDSWGTDTIIESSKLLQYTHTNLEEDTIYAFSVSAVREGDMGEGPIGPPMTVKTLCEAGLIAPTAVMVTVTDLNQLNVTWQVDDNDVTCSTGITGYTIYYKVDGSSDIPQRVTTVSGSTMYTIIEGLEPGENYTFMVSLTTDQENPLSEPSMAVTIPKSSISDGDKSFTVFIVIPAAFSIALLIIITFVLIYRKLSRKGSPTRSDPTSFTNNVEIDKENQDLPTEVKDKTEYIPLAKKEMLKSPDQYQNLNQPVSGDQFEGYEVPQDKITSLVESGSTYEAVGSTVVSKASTERELKQDNDYEDLVDIEQYAGVYINVDTAKKTTPPKPMKVSELQDYMSRDRRIVIEDVVKEFTVLPRGRQHPCSEALQHEKLKSKNSLSKIIPYDHTRVKLQVPGNTGESDYYNASMIKARNGKARFIAARGPQSKSLAEQFWRMVWQQNVRTLVMLVDSSDEDVYSYWPREVTTNEVFGEMTVLLQEATNHQTYTNRKLKIISDDDKILYVHQLQFHGWPKGGVPEDYTNLIDFIKQVKMKQVETKMSPMLIHCRDGSGSTGTFLALYQLVDVLRSNSTISIYNVIRNMREDRMDMVLTRVQYLYIYDTLQQAQLTPEKTITLAEEFKDMDDQTLNCKAVQEFSALTKIKELKMQQQQQMGESKENAYKNRFPGIIPLDSYRPVLKSNGVTHGSNDYVNATKLEDDGSIILTQDPLASILEDFWRLVYDYKCSTIIMLNDMSTANKTSAKYWPDSGLITYGSVTVKCVNTESQDLFRTQKFEVIHQDHPESVIVNHLTFEAFLGDDEDLHKMLDFIQSTRNITSGPTVMHCLNGVGVSAVYVTAKAQIQCLETEGACDLYLAVQKLRRKNVNFMLSQENYMLCLKLLRCYLNNQDDYSVIY
ncbi:uncharacterized protein [Apostichopus japonicus]|uniref:uncharacterized protein isoform X3 n=1 Tax=Stichopus japonicus TaxID=307972 RepID=UPI003AB56356